MRMMVIGVMGVSGTFRALIIFSLSSNAILNIQYFEEYGQKISKIKVPIQSIKCSSGNEKCFHITNTQLKTQT